MIDVIIIVILCNFVDLRVLGKKTSCQGLDLKMELPVWQKMGHGFIGAPILTKTDISKSPNLW